MIIDLSLSSSMAEVNKGMSYEQEKRQAYARAYVERILEVEGKLERA